MSFSAARLLNYLLHGEREVTWRTLALSDEECSIPPLFIECLFSFGTRDLSIEPPAAGRKRNTQKTDQHGDRIELLPDIEKMSKFLTKAADKTLPACIFKKTIKTTNLQVEHIVLIDTHSILLCEHDHFFGGKN